MYQKLLFGSWLKLRLWLRVGLGLLGLLVHHFASYWHAYYDSTKSSRKSVCYGKTLLVLEIGLTLQCAAATRVAVCGRLNSGRRTDRKLGVRTSYIITRQLPTSQHDVYLSATPHVSSCLDFYTGNFVDITIYAVPSSAPDLRLNIRPQHTQNLFQMST